VAAEALIAAAAATAAWKGEETRRERFKS